jgi:hypothetical protein
MAGGDAVIGFVFMMGILFLIAIVFLPFLYPFFFFIGVILAKRSSKQELSDSLS